VAASAPADLMAWWAAARRASRPLVIRQVKSGVPDRVSKLP
jgi:hypothetical protein